MRRTLAPFYVSLSGGGWHHRFLAHRREEQAGKIALEPVVGDHILLGADHIDAAMAHHFSHWRSCEREFGGVVRE